MDHCQLTDALNLLEHYHTDHTTDGMTRFQGKGHVDIYVVSDPDLRKQFREFSDPLTESTGIEKLPQTQ